jgi:hypothetical protein
MVCWYAWVSLNLRVFLPPLFSPCLEFHDCIPTTALTCSSVSVFPKTWHYNRRMHCSVKELLLCTYQNLNFNYIKFKIYRCINYTSGNYHTGQWIIESLTQQKALLDSIDLDPWLVWGLIFLLLFLLGEGQDYFIGVTVFPSEVTCLPFCVNGSLT